MREGRVREQHKSPTSLANGIFVHLSDLIIHSSSIIPPTSWSKAELVKTKRVKRMAAVQVFDSAIISAMKVI